MVGEWAGAGGKMKLDEQVKTHYDRILFLYDLQPKKIEQHGKVSKIVTSRGSYALKETTLNTEQQAWFRHVLERLYSLRFPVVPLLPTKYGDILVNRGGSLYYLMPWIQEQEPTRYVKAESVLDLTANLHFLTVKEQDYSPDMVESSQALLEKRWGEQQVEFEQFASSAEHHVYQSPFELQFLSHFHQLMSRAEEAKSHLKSWKDKSLDTKQLRTVLCHGKLSPHHVIMTQNKPALINFERAVLDTPVRDLAIFLRRACLYLTLDADQWYRMLNSYETIFPLNDEERTLLKSYLTYPEPFYNLLNQYKHPENKMNELTFVQRFEHHLLQFNQMNYILNYLNEQPNPNEEETTEGEVIEEE